MTHGVLSEVLYFSWFAALLCLMVVGPKRSLTFQWVGAIALSVLGIWQAVWEHQGPGWITLYVAIALIGFPYVAVQHYRKRRHPHA